MLSTSRRILGPLPLVLSSFLPPTRYTHPFHVPTRAMLLVVSVCRIMEKGGLIPVPIFINGVEAHTVVRDLLTSSEEQRQRAQGVLDIDSLSPDCVEVCVCDAQSLPASDTALNRGGDDGHI